MHLDAEKIERLLDREMSREEGRAWRDHLAGCADCRSMLEAAERTEREIVDLLGLLDHPVPDADPRRLARRADRQGFRRTLAAAALAFVVVAGAASAMPGSPVRGWLARVFAGPLRPPTVGEGTEPATTQPSGVSVLPSAEFELVFQEVQDSGLLRITLSDQPEVSVQSERNGVGYSVEPRAVRVLNVGSRASYQVVIPESAPSIRIRVGETTVLEKDGTSIVTSAARDAGGDYLVDFASLHR